MLKDSNGIWECPSKNLSYLSIIVPLLLPSLATSPYPVLVTAITYDDDSIWALGEGNFAKELLGQQYRTVEQLYCCDGTLLTLESIRGHSQTTPHIFPADYLNSIRHPFHSAHILIDRVNRSARSFVRRARALLE